MSSLNKVLLIGRLGRDPEVRFTSAGDPVCTLNVATSERFRDNSGEQRENTEWHRVVLYRRQAEVARDYLRKGALVFVEGSLKTRKWTDKNGQDRYTTEIEAREMKMLGGTEGGGRGPEIERDEHDRSQPFRPEIPTNRSPGQMNDDWEVPF